MRPAAPPFLETLSRRQWKRLGAERRAGAATPLFSVFSRQSAGVGEFPDIELLARWCERCGMSIIQLLPLNDMGTTFRPYDAESAFGLEPMHLALGRLRDVAPGSRRAAAERIRSAYPTGRGRYDPRVKPAKLAALWGLFRERRRSAADEKFTAANAFWLEDYALYRLLKEFHGGKRWENWPEAYRSRDPRALERLRLEHGERIEFFRWLQRQLDAQFREAKERAGKKGVFLMGDLPFLVSRDSADVWAHPGYFKLDRAAGAPPDAFFAGGQCWGMPPYDWERVASDDYRYLTEKLAVAARYYDLLRIDHVVGIFRVWTAEAASAFSGGPLRGAFDPPDEREWERHGRRILKVVVERSPMLACAEDLGVVPDCARPVLAEYGIPGMEVVRWARDWNGTREFVAPSDYRANSIAVMSTHDTSTFAAWWRFEAGSVGEEAFRARCREKNVSFDAVKERLFDAAKSAHGRLRLKTRAISVALTETGADPRDFEDLTRDAAGEREAFAAFAGYGPPPDDPNPAFVEKVLRTVSSAASVFSIQLLQDWLSLDPALAPAGWDDRINFPGTVNDRNWTLAARVGLEEMLKLDINAVIRRINRGAGRAA